MGALYDLVGFSTTTTGTGTLTVGAALPGHLTLAGAGIPDGTTVSYGISSADGSAREVGNGVVGGSGTTLTRELSSSSTGSLLNLSGTSEVTVTVLAADIDGAKARANHTGTQSSSTITMATARLLGRTTAGSGATEEIAVGSGLSLTAGTLSATGGGGSPAGSGTELQVRSGSSFGAVAGSSWTDATKTLRLPADSKLFLHGTYDAGLVSESDGYLISIKNRYGSAFQFRDSLVVPLSLRFEDHTYGPIIVGGSVSSPPAGNLNAWGNSLRQAWLIGQYGGVYAESTNAHHGRGWSVWAGPGATTTTTDANGGNAGTVDIWLNAGGAGNGTGAAGARGKLRVVNDATDAEVWSVDQLGNMVQAGGTFRPAHYTTATRPAWANGAVFFDDDLDKLVVGGVSAWEVVTST